MFAGAGVVYGALKSGYLDSLPVVAHGDLGGQITLSMIVGMPAGGALYDRTKKHFHDKK
jgi:hypothetical protein